MDVASVAAGWLSDPTGRHQHRYWDGTAWTQHVSDQGRQAVDPIGLAPAAPAVAPAAWLADPASRHEHRYWDGGSWTEHVADNGRESVDPGPPGLPAPLAGVTGGLGVAPGAAGAVHTTSGFAIASMVLGILWLYWIGSVLALVFGYIALSRIRAGAGFVKGKGMAIAGVVLGWVGIACLVLVIVLAATTHVLDVHQRPDGKYCSNNPDSIFPRC